MAAAPRNTRRRPSLGAVWLASVLVPLAAAVVAAILLTELASRRTASALAAEVQHQVGERVRSEVATWLDEPHRLNQANADLLASGALALQDDLELQRHFRDQLGQSPEVSYVQVGREADGGFVGLERVESGALRLEVTDHPRTGKEAFLLDDDGSVSSGPVARVEGYDARSRPWYRAAVVVSGPAWSPIYQFSARDTPRLGITAVRPFFDSDGQRAGVLGADLVISRLAVLLAAAAPEHGRVALVERNGMVVASSGALSFQVDAQGVASRSHYMDASDPLLAATAAAIEARVHLAGLAAPLFVPVPSQDALAWAAPVTDARGLDWVVVVSTPVDAILQGVDLDSQRALGAGLVLLAVAVAIAAVMARRVASPVFEVAAAASALAVGDRSHPVPDPGTQELWELAEAFRAMRERLTATLDEAAKARSDAESSNRAKSVFLASMSHELRTPLNAIVGYNDLLIETLDDAPVEMQRGDLQRVRESALHLLRLINDLLDLARIESGRLEITITPVVLPPLLASVVEQLRPVVEARGNRLVLSIADDVLPVRADPVRLQQVLINLLGNAAKFTTHGTITLSCWNGGDRVHLAVADDGVGMASGTLQQIFEPFMRLDGAQGLEGAGLGLAIVKRLLVAMGGTIAVESSPGVGSTFEITLQLDASES